MAQQFQVSAPLGDLVFSHAGRTLTVSGNKDAAMDWRHQNGRVLYGAFGHIFDETDCSLADVYSMLLDLYGQELVATSADVKSIVKQELRSIPEGVVP